MQKIIAGDKVKVISGKDSKNGGKEGTVTKVINHPKRGKLLIVEGVHVVKKHERGNPNMQKPGGIIEKEAPIQASNVAIVNPKTGKADRVGFKFLEDGTKVRVYKSDGEVIVNG